MVEDETGTENDINYISELKGQFFLNPVLSITLQFVYLVWLNTSFNRILL